MAKSSSEGDTLVSACLNRRSRVHGTLSLICKLLVLIFAFSMVSNAQIANNDAKLAGCYETTSLTWNPRPDVEIAFIPRKFQLMDKVYDSRSPRILRVHDLGPSPNRWEFLWIWTGRSDEQSLRITLSHGLGGFRGTLHRSKDGSLRGRLKEYCDGRCEWKRETALILARKVACPN